MANFNVLRIITPKICNSGLWFLCIALCVMVLNMCVKFHENISNGYDATERTGVCGRNGNFQCSKGNNSKIMHFRITVHALCTSSKVLTFV